MRCDEVVMARAPSRLAGHRSRMHVRAAGCSYTKGLVAEVSQFLFGKGFAISGGDAWKARRKAVGPALHR